MESISCLGLLKKHNDMTSQMCQNLRPQPQVLVSQQTFLGQVSLFVSSLFTV